MEEPGVGAPAGALLGSRMRVDAVAGAEFVPRPTLAPNIPYVDIGIYFCTIKSEIFIRVLFEDSRSGWKKTGRARGTNGGPPGRGEF